MIRDLRGWREVMRLAWIPLALVLLSAIDSKSINLGFQKHPVYHSKLAPDMGPIFKPISLDEFLEQSSHEFDRFPRSWTFIKLIQDIPTCRAGRGWASTILQRPLNLAPSSTTRS